MKLKYLMAGSALCGMFLMTAAPAARALTLTDTLIFPVDTAARDTRSGNHPDFHYRHELPEITGYGTITDVRLRLTHSGNSDTGPTTEIWHILLGPEAYLAGRLSESRGEPVTDEWNLPRDFFNQPGWRETALLDLFLSEQTAYSFEKLDLLRSEVRIEAQPSVVPQAPEPASLLLLASALAVCLICRRTGRPAVTRP